MEETGFQPIGDEGRDHVHKSLEITSPTKMHCKPPDNEGNLWVFWKSEEEEFLQTLPKTETRLFNDSIKTWLLKVHQLWFARQSCLIQFWMVKSKPKTKDCLILTVSDQPFGVSSIQHEGLMRYRKHIMRSGDIQIDLNLSFGILQQQKKFIVERVFLRGLAEYSPDIGCYQFNEFPLREFAVNCGIKSCAAIPVVEVATQQCVGILECLFTDGYIGYEHENMLRGIVENGEMGLLKAQLCDPSPFERMIDNEVQMVLNELCRGHRLPIVIFWGLLKDTHTMFKLHGRPRKLLVPLSQTCYFVPSTEFMQVEVGQGLVGQTFLFQAPHFCKDVTKLHITDYPLAHHASYKHLSSSFAFIVKSKSFIGKSAVAELLFFQDNPYNPQTLVSDFMKRSFQGFEVDLGEEGKEVLFREVLEYSSSGYYNNILLQRCYTLRDEVKVVDQGSLHHQQITPVHKLEDGLNIILEEREKHGIPLGNQGATGAKKPSCSKEELARYFGAGEEFAKNHDVGRSTVMRWCHGYKPAPNSENVHGNKYRISKDDMVDVTQVQDTRKKRKEREENELNLAGVPVYEVQHKSFSLGMERKQILLWLIFKNGGNTSQLLVDFEHERLSRANILMSLTPMARLNDNIINAASCMLTAKERRLSNNPHQRRTWYLPTYVHRELCKDPPDVKSILKDYMWYMGDLRACNKIFVPMVDMNQHWYMCVIDFKDKVIELLDSLPDTKRCYPRLIEVLKLRDRLAELLRHIGGEEDATNVRSLEVHAPNWVPVQDNAWDSGLFAIKFMQEKYGPNKAFKDHNSKRERVQLAVDMVLHEDNKQMLTILEQVESHVPLIIP